MTSFVSQVGSVAALADPIRRDLYAFVSAQAEAVSRDQAAAAVGVPSHKAKFHLDRLSESGLLEVEYRRLSGKVGPGAGRPTKLYRRADREVSVSLPPREYDLAATIMAAAIEASVHDGTPLTEALRTCAQAAGRALAARTNPAGGAEPGQADDRRETAAPLDQLCAVLNDHGYEPRLEPDDDGGQRVVMANCPFHSLSRTHTELVCGLNSDLIHGLTETLGSGVVTAQLEPAPGRCCVVLRAQEPGQRDQLGAPGAAEPR